MKNISNRESVIIRDTPNNQFVLYKSTKKECTKIYNNIEECEKIVGHPIISFGDTADITEDYVMTLLDKPIFINNIFTGKMENSYKCFCVKDQPQLTPHATAISSWHCLMTSIGNPEYVIIILKNK